MIFKQVFRIAFITLIWKQYKAPIISTALLLFSLFLISQIHSDILANWALQNDTSQTGSSFLYKWLAYTSVIVIYCLYHYFRPKKNGLSESKKNKIKQQKLKVELDELADDEDPFNAIRQRKKLRSRSDFILKK